MGSDFRAFEALYLFFISSPQHLVIMSYFVFWLAVVVAFRL